MLEYSTTKAAFNKKIFYTASVFKFKLRLNKFKIQALSGTFEVLNSHMRLVTADWTTW